MGGGIPASYTVPKTDSALKNALKSKAFGIMNPSKLYKLPKPHKIPYKGYPKSPKFNHPGVNKLFPPPTPVSKMFGAGSSKNSAAALFGGTAFPSGVGASSY